MEGAIGLEGRPDSRKENQGSPPYQEPLKSPIVRRALVSVFAYVLLLTLIGIIYKDELSWSRRSAYLAISALLCLPICIFYGIFTDHLSRLRVRAAGALSMAASALLSAGSATVLVYGLDRLFRAGFMPNRMRDPYVLALAALLVCASVAQYALLRRHRVEDSVPQVEEASTGGDPRAGSGPPEGLLVAAENAGARFFTRLPVQLGRDIVYLKMSDHYVEVFTTTGHAVLLMRFADAVSELEGLGVRVHRSYWVGRAHVRRLSRRGRRIFLRLASGVEVPVSRTYLHDIEAELHGTAGDA